MKSAPGSGRSDPFKLQQYPHRRRNPLTGQWVLVSPHRLSRPWRGQTEAPAEERLPSYDPCCYLCPGNLRAAGNRNPDYTDTFAFDNDFPAVLPDSPEGSWSDSGLLTASAERGRCRVICFSPRHDLSLARMDPSGVEQVVETWRREVAQLAGIPWVNYVQVFENKGALMGCSNPHPHCQIWATQSIPDEPWREQEGQARYLSETGGCLLCRYLERELELGERVVFRTPEFLAVVPFWAVWPFELMLIPTTHFSSFAQLSDNGAVDLASALKQAAVRYDNLFQTSFPYSMGFHQAPCDGRPHPEWHFHAHFYPPLLRSATVRKFMVGFEMLATPQRDLTPETAAAMLRDLSEIHYLDGAR
ncbi:MAG: UDP-glucose--hexose-1-phosphate uridylyltransferase [Acidobacteriota bacterium]